MAGEYVDRDTLKLWLKIKLDDTQQDDLIDLALAGAVDWINKTTGRRFTLDESSTARTYRVQGRAWLTDDWLHGFVVDDIGSTTGLTVEIGSVASGWTAVTDFDTSPDNAITLGRPITTLLRTNAWTCGSTDRLRVTARWGWPTVPDNVKQACLIQAARLFRRKDSPEGVMGGSEWGTVLMTRVDPDAKALLDPVSLPGFA